tara:strand:+ start:2001 stop:2339 length:339 start_codon:yes stop_codon:yes gene_type:complete
MFNLNLDFKNIDHLFNSPAFLFVLFVISCMISLMFGIHLGPVSKKEVCQEELLLIEVQQKQIQHLEFSSAACVSTGETQCIEREQRICRQEKERIKTNCNHLIDRLNREECD